MCSSSSLYKPPLCISLTPSEQEKSTSVRVQQLCVFSPVCVCVSSSSTSSQNYHNSYKRRVGAPELREDAVGGEEWRGVLGSHCEEEFAEGIRWQGGRGGGGGGGLVGEGAEDDHVCGLVAARCREAPGWGG